MMPVMHPFPTSAAIHELLARELADDLGIGDLSTLPFPDWQTRQATAELQCRANGVLAGIEIAALVWETAAPEQVKVEPLAESGSRIAAGQVLARITGPAAALLAGERTVLNAIGHLSGIATLTARYVEAVAGTEARICDTRKTLPGLRTLQKYAVRCGGGVNHRASLDAAVMLKDNHLALLAEPLADAVRRVKAASGPATLVQVEVTTLEQCAQALAGGADALLLDNMTPEQVGECVALCPPGVRIEASGGLTLETVRAYAEAGVHYLSIGRLTHSAPALDLSLEMLPG